MKKSKWFHRFLVASSLAFALGIAQPAAAEEGGAVKTNGAITFYETSTDSSSSEAPVPSSEEPTPSSEAPAPSDSELPVTKPAGKYPSTGELVKKSLTFSGAALVLGVLLLFIWKRRKEGGAER